MAKVIDYQEAINAGYSAAEIQDFVKSNPGISLANGPAPLKSEGQTPDIVSPFYNENVVKTQAMNENPQIYGPGGHQGEDYAYQNSDTSQLRTPIGGIALTGFQPGGYGNVMAVAGANPAEIAQMSEEDKKKLVDEWQQYIGGAKSLQDFPTLRKFSNVALLGHGAEAAPYQSGEPVATGSAVFKEGETGWATGPHAHIESTQQGQEVPFSDLMEIVRSRQYR